MGLRSFVFLLELFTLEGVSFGFDIPPAFKDRDTVLLILLAFIIVSSFSGLRDGNMLQLLTPWVGLCGVRSGVLSTIPPVGY